MIRNVPTDLLRTFVMVAELRSFTRAAKAQGMTQPAVSAQIRRLQALLGVDLLDKSSPGVSLTPVGELVIASARRMLSVNDHIVQIASPNPAVQVVRIGLPGDCMGPELLRVLASSRKRWPNLRFAVEGGGQRQMFRDLKQDEIDLAVSMVIYEPEGEARHYWTEELAWVRGKSTTLDPSGPVPLISYKDTGICHSVAMAALDKIGRGGDLVFRATNAEALRSAVAAGLGVMVMPRRRVPAALEVWDDGPLPPLHPLYCGVFLREGADSAFLEQLADHIAQTLRPPAGETLVFTSPPLMPPASARPSL